jgi:sulfur-carrier protein adenylyltransferase/sulfurtransferase
VHGMHCNRCIEVKQKLDRGDTFTLIDVREPHEYQIARIPGAVLIPLGQLPNRLGELDKDAEIVAHCKSGGRSQKAVDLLKQNGFRNVRNMTGGISAWSDKVDPKTPKY